jgi:NAD(P)-dependent dehydrogenase (short-subunit alcohol dehydrogenase family)
MDLRERVALVTGGASGIGAACAAALAGCGARLLVADVDGDGAGRAAASLPGAGHEAVRLDVSDGTAIEALFERLAAEAVDLAAVVNAAGILTGGEPWPASTPERMLRTLLVNAGGAVVITTLAARFPGPIPRAVVNVASTAAIRPLPPDPVYGLTKAGLVHFTRSAALAAPPGVRAHVLLPGIVDTPLLRHSGGARPATWLEGALERPLLSPADVAAAVLRVLTDDDAPVAVLVDMTDDGVVEEILPAPWETPVNTAQSGPS